MCIYVYAYIYFAKLLKYVLIKLQYNMPKENLYNMFDGFSPGSKQVILHGHILTHARVCGPVPTRCTAHNKRINAAAIKTIKV